MKILFKICLAHLILLASTASAQVSTSSKIDPEKIDTYKPRFGRTQPVVAVVALNEGTELTDFIIPFGVLARSGTSKVISVAVKPGEVSMRPLTFNLQSTLNQFDKEYPQGADYVIVPAVQNSKDPDLVNWVKSQGEKGATLVSICMGAMVVANTGLMDGHRATTYFAYEKDRLKSFPNVKWQSNIRYVSDGKIVSSAGISASIPVSIALAEAIGGHHKALALAEDLGITQWSSIHNSDVFQDFKGPHNPRSNDLSKESTGIPVEAGDDEIAIGLAADALSMTGKTSVYIVSDSHDPVTLANGLEVIPKKIKGTDTVSRLLPAVSGYKSIEVIDRTLEDIARLYGSDIAYSVGRIMEYPGFVKYKSAKD